MWTQRRCTSYEGWHDNWAPVHISAELWDVKALICKKIKLCLGIRESRRKAWITRDSTAGLGLGQNVSILRAEEGIPANTGWISMGQSHHLPSEQVENSFPGSLSPLLFHPWWVPLWDEYSSMYWVGHKVHSGPWGVTEKPTQTSWPNPTSWGFWWEFIYTILPLKKKKKNFAFIPLLNNFSQ